ncbi:MAG: hypothetical protein LBJ10_06405 [Clostridiales bacterium]|nr:hypothetical protein [Clostridiales bacterium]
MPVALYLVGMAQPQSKTYFDQLYGKTVREELIMELLYAAEYVSAGGLLCGVASILLLRERSRRKSDKLHVSGGCALALNIVATLALGIYLIIGT